MRSLILLAVFAATQAPAAAPALDATPRCSDQFECEVTWSEAQRALGTVSNMRLRMATDSRLETFPPMRAGHVGAVVTREPVAPGTYEIKIRLECYRSLPCDAIQAEGTRLFNLSVNSGVGAKKPLPPSTETK